MMNEDGAGFGREALFGDTLEDAVFIYVSIQMDAGTINP